MSDNSPFLALEQPCDAAVEWLTDRVIQAGLKVMRTFNLQVARLAQSMSPCPHHGTEQCDCQMVVLLIYDANLQPLTVIAHGYNNRTWFSMVDTPQQRPDPATQGIIMGLCTPISGQLRR